MVDSLVQVRPLPVRPEQMQHSSFDERPALLGRDRTIEPLRRPNQSGVDPVELGVSSLPHAQFRFERQQPIRKQGVLQDLQVALHRRSGDAAITRQPRDIHGGAVAEGGNRQKTSETGQVPDQRLRTDLLAQIELYVAFERRPTVLGSTCSTRRGTRTTTTS